MIWYGIDHVDDRHTMYHPTLFSNLVFLFLIFIKLSVDNIDHIDGLLTPDLSADNIPV